jgi:hypothetical protein
LDIKLIFLAALGFYLFKSQKKEDYILPPPNVDDVLARGNFKEDGPPGTASEIGNMPAEKSYVADLGLKGLTATFTPPAGASNMLNINSDISKNARMMAKKTSSNALKGVKDYKKRIDSAYSSFGL